MGIFNISKHDDVTTRNSRFMLETNTYALYEAMDAKLLRQVVDELTTKIVAEIYPEVIKQLDKELIVKEVAMRVSDEVIQKLFSQDKKEHPHA